MQAWALEKWIIPYHAHMAGIAVDENSWVSDGCFLSGFELATVTIADKVVCLSPGLTCC